MIRRIALIVALAIAGVLVMSQPAMAFPDLLSPIKGLTTGNEGGGDGPGPDVPDVPDEPIPDGD